MQNNITILFKVSVGIAGTWFSLSNIHIIAGTLAGLGTFAFMMIQAYYLIKNKGRK